MVSEITKKHHVWVFDGNRFSASKVDGRFDQCDILIHLDTHPWLCLFRVIKRFLKHRYDKRRDLADGCDEALDLEHLKYIIHDYPKRANKRQVYINELKERHPHVVVLTNKVEIKKWLSDNQIK